MPLSDQAHEPHAITPIYSTKRSHGEERSARERDLHLLGAELARRAPEIAAHVIATGADGSGLDPELARSFERLAGAWTLAVARWMTGEGEVAARESGEECLRIFTDLAARRLAPVDQILRLCLRWRDASGHVAARLALRQHLSAKALLSVQSMLQRSLDVTAVRLCECFEAERRHTDEQLRFRATRDAVTGLPNRTLISQRISELLERAHRDRATIALMFIDLDNFKLVNDTLGHPAGDELLRSVTVRLAGVAPDGDRLGRFGGDEFVVIVDDVSCAESAEHAAQQVLDALAEPFTLMQGSVRLKVSASIGVALTDSAPADTLLRDADIAMYRAKRQGRNRYCLITSRS